MNEREPQSRPHIPSIDCAKSENVYFVGNHENGLVVTAAATPVAALPPPTTTTKTTPLNYTHGPDRDRRYSCPQCSKCFTSQSGLKQHMNIHASFKPFTCQVCHKSYTQFSNLCRHKRLHKRCRQRLECSTCGHEFANSYSLIKHQLLTDCCFNHNQRDFYNRRLKELTLLGLKTKGVAHGLRGLRRDGRMIQITEHCKSSNWNDLPKYSFLPRNKKNGFVGNGMPKQYDACSQNMEQESMNLNGGKNSNFNLCGSSKRCSAMTWPEQFLHTDNLIHGERSVVPTKQFQQSVHWSIPVDLSPKTSHEIKQHSRWNYASEFNQQRHMHNTTLHNLTTNTSNKYEESQEFQNYCDRYNEISVKHNEINTPRGTTTKDLHILHWHKLVGLAMLSMYKPYDSSYKYEGSQNEDLNKLKSTDGVGTTESVTKQNPLTTDSVSAICEKMTTAPISNSLASEQLYKCTVCQKTFPRAANLNRHIRTHTGEQPYQCPHCDRSFSISSNMQRHVRNIHRKSMS